MIETEEERAGERGADEKQGWLEIVNSGRKRKDRNLWGSGIERDSWLRKQWRESRQLQKDMFLKNERILSNGGLLRIKLEYIYIQKESKTQKRKI